MVTAEQVKALRERTGAGMMECKRALEAAQGDVDKAVELLRERGVAQAAKKAGREASEGLVESYIHLQGRLGVLVELNCETDFVANTAEFRALAHDIAMHIAASSPRYVARTEVPSALIDQERAVLTRQAEHEGKPAPIIAKMVQGRLEKFYQELVLLEQPFIKNPEQTVDQVVKEYTARLGERIIVRRFSRFERGEALDGGAT